MPSTTYLSFTSEGGRIGRVAWSNGDEETWGDVHWDRWWPYQRPTPTQLAKIVAVIQQSGMAIAKALTPVVQQATDAINAFGAAMAKAAQDEAMKQNHATQSLSQGGQISPGTSYRI